MAKGVVKARTSWLVLSSTPFISILDKLRASEYQKRFEDFQEKVD